MNTQIIVTNSMFSRGNIKVLFENGKIDTYDTINPAYVLELAEKYNTPKIFVMGNALYNIKYIRQLEEAQMKTYSELKIKIINGLKENN